MHLGIRSFLRSKSSSMCNSEHQGWRRHTDGAAAAVVINCSALGASLHSIAPVLTLLCEHGCGSYCAEESAQRNQPSTVNKLLWFSAARRRLHDRLRALQHSAGRHVEHWPHTHPRC
jgi:hypothetical protein